MFTERPRTLTTRRDALLAAGALLGGALLPRVASARGRIALGGELSMRVPWPVAAIDPHRLDDAGALLFGACLFDSLYALDSAGAIVPSLAEGHPESIAEGTRVTLRDGLRFASGKRLTSRDVVQSMARARGLGARAWLDALGPVRAAGAGAVVFASRAADHVARTLTSPLTAIVPDHFAPEQPDGTGPFAARWPGGSSGALVLGQNPFAASGPSILDRVTIAPAPDLAASLRAFESGEDDLGWLGLGLHEPRRGAVPFDAGARGWAILRTGDLVRRWNLPGVAQRLADGIEPSRLAHLGVQPNWTVDPSEGWGGPPVSLLVREDSPWLVELARAVAAALSRADHDVSVLPVSAPELSATRASRGYALAIDLVRPFDRTPFGAYAALTAADDPSRGVEMCRHPPLGATAAPRTAGRVLSLGVIADVHFSGGHMPDLALPIGSDGIDFGSIIHPRSRVP